MKSDHPLATALSRPGEAAGYAVAAALFRANGDRRRMANQLVHWALTRGFDDHTFQGLRRHRFFVWADYVLFYLHSLEQRQIDSNDLESMLERYLVRTRPLSDGKLRAALTWLKRPVRHPASPPPVFVAAMPKSASTYFCNLLQSLLGGAVTTPHSQNDRTGVGFDFLSAVRALSIPGVVHSHLPGDTRTLALLDLFKVRPIILVRNIHDAIASYVDHFAGRAYAGSRASTMPEQARIESALARIAPFYVDFFATWWLYSRRAQAKLVHYNDVVAHPIETIADCLAWLGWPMDVERVSSAIVANDPRAQDQNQLQRMRFNVGRSGRGLSVLTADQIFRVRLLYAEFPEADFSVIDPDWVSASSDVPKTSESAQ